VAESGSRSPGENMRHPNLSHIPSFKEFQNLPMERKGESFRTFTGRRFWPLDPRPEDLDIEDIARGLALTNRFNGHTLVPYSVAQHSVLVSYMVPEGMEFEGLMHDASEAMGIGDLISPSKRQMSQYRRVEKRIMLAIRARYGMLRKEQPEVKLADTFLYYAEARDVANRPLTLQQKHDAPKKIIRAWGWRKAEREFLKRFYELRQGCDLSL
jgi:5'-deoxynucleotidase YfbR-like HD superfamily hydrolase